MRKTLICILALLMLLSSCLVACGGEDNNSIGDASKPSKGLEYALNEDGNSYSVTGIGDCTDAHLVIPSTHPDDGKPITKIENHAFDDCDWLKSVIIPDSVTSIGNSAFFRCEKLASVIIPDSVTSFGNSVFNSTAYYNNESNWENDVLYIGKYLISAKDSLSGSYSIKDGTVCIVGSAFYHCEEITDITIPNSVMSIGSFAFDSCKKLTSITIGNGVTSIENSAFSWSEKLTRITYQGTKAQWKAISKRNGWKDVTGDFTVYCTDGEISKADA